MAEPLADMVAELFADDAVHGWDDGSYVEEAEEGVHESDKTEHEVLQEPLVKKAQDCSAVHCTNVINHCYVVIAV